MEKNSFGHSGANIKVLHIVAWHEKVIEMFLPFSVAEPKQLTNPNPH